MTPANELRNELARFLAGSLSLDKLQESLDHATVKGDAEAKKLAQDIEWAFCDLERGLSETVLREKLARLARLPQESRAYTVVAMTYVDGFELQFANEDLTLNQTQVATGSSSRLPLGALPSSTELAGWGLRR